MNEISVRKPKAVADPSKFSPAEALARDAKVTALMDYAARVEDRALLKEAAQQKVLDQQDFLEWWNQNVRRAGQGNNPDPGYFVSCDYAEEITGISQQRVSKWRKRLKDPETYTQAIIAAAWRKANGEQGDSELLQQSISNEHYTPLKYIEAARQVMGGIDLDPATCATANNVVKAAKIFTQADDGLKHPWYGRIWLNPPYGRMAGDFIAKLMTEFVAGNAEAAIVLVNAHCTDTEWFRPLWNGVLCFTDHRINFYGDDTRSGSTHGSVFAYFGVYPLTFADGFRAFGTVVTRISDDHSEQGGV